MAHFNLKNDKIFPMNSPSVDLGAPISYNGSGSHILPPEAEKKLQNWIRSRHLICVKNFFIFESLDYSAVERFATSIRALGGTVINITTADKIWMGDHRQVLLYRAKASLYTPCHDLKQYWIKYGSFRTRFDERC
jgi:phycoerythrin-associated linker protein